MKNIGRRIYYELSTGNIILDTGERSGDVIETTIEQDFISYTMLFERVSSAVGVLELQYGQFAEDFTRAKGYRVNTSMGILEFNFTTPDPNEPDVPPVYTPSLTEKVEQIEAVVFKKNPNEVFLTLNVQNTNIEDLKAKKVEQLDYLCNQTILNGFVSDCLGDDYTYGFDMEDQANLTGRLTLISADPTNPKLQQFNWKTKNGGILLHTKEQFVELCVDADNHKDDNIASYWSLKSQVELAATKEAVLNIQW